MTTYRSVFLSDIHLGNPWCKARDLLEFLSSFSCQRLYLVGDIIDGWQSKNARTWPPCHNRVLQELFRFSQKVPVIYITGNHDSFLDKYHGNIFGNITIAERTFHRSPDGTKLLVLHGDEFDEVMNRSPWLARIGDAGYNCSLQINRLLNALRKRMGLPYWSFSQYLKHRVKDMVNALSHFEERLQEEMDRCGTQGIICGHIHRPALKDLGSGLYANCGDWLESCSALAEHHDGTLELLHWAKKNHHEGPRVTAEGELVFFPEDSPEELQSLLTRKIR